MTKSKFYAGPAVFQDQREVLQQQFGMPEDAAEETFTTVKTQVILSAREMDKDLSDREADEITNVLLAQANAQEIDRVQHESKTKLGLTAETWNQYYLVMYSVAMVLVGTFIGLSLATGVPVLSAKFLWPVAMFVSLLVIALM